MKTPRLTEYQTTCFTSTAYRYYRADLSAEQNEELYGSLASEQGTGCNFQLDAKLLCDPERTDLASLATLVKQTSLTVDHKFLNADIPQFQNTVPTLERVCMYLFESLQSSQMGDLRLRLWEGPYRWVEFDGETLRYGEACRISCVHKHWNPDWSEAKNQQVYGLCSGLHGHEYRVEVTLEGVLDQTTGWIYSRDKMQKTLRECIVEKFSGAYLNEYLGNTSGEKIALQFYEILKDQFMTQKLCRLGLFETRKNSFFAGASPF